MALHPHLFKITTKEHKIMYLQGARLSQSSSEPCPSATTEQSVESHWSV